MDNVAVVLPFAPKINAIDIPVGEPERAMMHVITAFGGRRLTHGIAPGNIVTVRPLHRPQNGLGTRED